MRLLQVDLKKGSVKGRVRGLRGVVSRDEGVMFFNNTNISARDKVPSFQDRSKLCGRGCSCPPRAVLDRAFFVQGPRRFFGFCESGVLYSATGPGTTRLGLTRVRRAKGLGTIVARGVSGLRRVTKDGGILRLRKDICQGRYVGYKGFCSFGCVGRSGNIPQYDYNNVVGPSIILCRRKLSSCAVRRSMEIVSRTRILVVKKASLTMCPTTNLVSCFEKGRLIIVGGTPAPESGCTSLLVGRPVKRIFSRVEI